MKILDWLCAIVVLALGIVHSALTPVIYRPLSLSALWFFAAGLALVFAGMLNVLRLKGPGSPLLHSFSSVANATLLLVAVLFALKVNLAHNPQGVVLLIALAGECLFSRLRGGGNPDLRHPQQNIFAGRLDRRIVNFLKAIGTLAAASFNCAATAPTPYCGTALAFKNRLRTAELARRFASALSSRRTCAMEN